MRTIHQIKFPRLFCLLTVVATLLPNLCLGRMEIERLMREIQARTRFHFDQTETWPDCFCGGDPAPIFPPDKFYGEKIEPHDAVDLIQALVDAIQAVGLGTTERYYTWASIYVDMDELDLTPDVSRSDVPSVGTDSPAWLTNNGFQVDLSNYSAVYGDVKAYIESLTHLLATVYYVDPEEPFDPQGGELTGYIRVDTTDDLTSEIVQCDGDREELLGTRTAYDPNNSPYANKAGHREHYYLSERAGGVTGYLWESESFLRIAALGVEFPHYSEPNPDDLARDLEVHVLLREFEDGIGYLSPPKSLMGQDLAVGQYTLYSEATVSGSHWLSLQPMNVETEEVFPKAEIGCKPFENWYWYEWEVHSDYSIALYEPDFGGVKVNDAECSSCSGPCTPGALTAETSSLHVNISLGKDRNGKSAGRLYFSAESGGDHLTDPDSLKWRLSNETTRGSHSPSGVDYFEAAQVVVIVNEAYGGAYEYSLDFYHPADYDLVSMTALDDPFKRVVVHSPDDGSGHDENRVVFSEWTGQATSSDRDHDFLYDASSQGWTLRQGEGGVHARITTHSETVNEATETRTDRRTLLNADEDTVFIEEEDWRQFDWGLQRVAHRLDPDGLNLSSTQTFYENDQADNYGNPKLAVRADGTWTFNVDYDMNDRETVVETGFLDGEPEEAGHPKRIVRTEYDNSGSDQEIITRIDQIFDGNQTYEIARTYTVHTSTGTETQRAVEPQAPLDSPRNLKWVTQRITDGWIHDGKPEWTINPDNTGTHYEYNQDGDDLETVATTGWVPNYPTSQTFDRGRRVTTVTDVSGNLDSRMTEWFEPSLSEDMLIDSVSVTSADAFGRPLDKLYLNQETDHTTYGCCGVDVETDRMGITTTYGHDALGRQDSTTRGGVTTVMVYGPNDQVIRTETLGDQGGVIVNEIREYDLAGRLTNQVDALGRPTAYSYGTLPNGHRYDAVRYPDGGTVTNEYYLDGTLFQVTGTAVSPVRYTYGVESIDVLYWEAGVPTTLNIYARYTKEIRVASDGSENEWTKTYTDMLGRTVRVQHADGSASIQVYELTNGRLMKSVDPDDVVTLYAYNELGEREVVAIDMDANDAIDFGGLDRVSKTQNTYLEANIESVDYTIQRTTTSQWNKEGVDAEVPLVLSVADIALTSRDRWSRALNDPDRTTHSTTTTDGQGQRVDTVSYPDGRSTISTNIDGRAKSAHEVDANAAPIRSTVYGFDEFGRQETVTDGRNGDTTYQLDDAGQVQSVTSPAPTAGESAQTTTYLYDPMGRVTNETSAAGSVTRQYDLAGRLTNTFGALTYPVAYSYDAQGRMKTMTTWQEEGNDAAKAVTTWNYHPFRGYLESKVYADGNGTSYLYTDAGRLSKRTWARDVGGALTTTYSYDDGGALDGVDYSDATADLVYVNDRLGRPATVTEGGAIVRQLQYTPDGKLDREEVSGGPADYILDPVYDDYGRRESLDLSDGVNSLWHTTYGPDAASRLETVTHGPHTATYSYEPNAAYVSGYTIGSANGQDLVVTRGHDALNRLRGVTNRLNGVSTLSAYTYAYNDLNQRTRVTHQDNSFWEYQYDALGQLTHGAKKLDESTPLSGYDFGYDFDDIGNRLTATANGQVSTYTPDGDKLNQYANRTVPPVVDLLGSADPTATVTINMQPTTQQQGFWHGQLDVDNAGSDAYTGFDIVGVVNDAGPGGEDAVSTETRDVYLGKALEAFVYDDDGNLTSDGRWTYSWDAENRLVRMETHASTVGPEYILTFDYDYLGRRAHRRVEDVSNGTTNDTYYVYDGWNLIAELDPAATPIRTYVWGLDLSGSEQGAGGVGGLLMMIDGPSTNYASFDGNGNLTGLMDSLDGSQAAVYEYDPFGNLLRATGPMANENPFRFSTKYQDDETGLLYYGYRYYDPDTARFLNRDPMSDMRVRWGLLTLDNMYGRLPPESEIQLYLFARNSPQQYYDPDGREACAATLTTVWGGALVEPTPVGEVVAIGVTITVGVAVCAKGIRSCFCKYRHPTWMRCRHGATASPIMALARDAVPIPGWTGPLLAGVHPRGAALRCPGGAPGTRFGMEVNYVRHTETGIIRYELEIPVNCCACCNIFTSGVSCEVVHPGRGSGGAPLPPVMP